MISARHPSGAHQQLDTRGARRLLTVIPAIGDKLDVVMVAEQVEGPWDNPNYSTACWRSSRPSTDTKVAPVHAISRLRLASPTSKRSRARARGCRGSARARRPRRLTSHEDDTRRWRDITVYQVVSDPDPENPEPRRLSAQQDPGTHFARMVDDATPAGILPFYGPFGAIEDPVACQYQFRGPVPDGLRRRLDAAPKPDRDRQA